MSPIRSERERLGWTQVALAVRAGVSPMTLRRAEQFGESAVTKESMRKILAALADVSLQSRPLAERAGFLTPQIVNRLAADLGSRVEDLQGNVDSAPGDEA